MDRNMSIFFNSIGIIIGLTLAIIPWIIGIYLIYLVIKFLKLKIREMENKNKEHENI